MRPSDHYCGFADLAQAQREGLDFRVVDVPVRGSRLAILAPHGGKIEIGKSAIAQQVAGDTFNLYMLEGIRPSGNYDQLHLTSTRFDDPRCIRMVESCDQVIAFHGCDGAEPQALIGGLDTELKTRIAESLTKVGIETLTVGHKFPGTDVKNICNRGRQGRGVQIELTLPLRKSILLVKAGEAVLQSLKEYGVR